LSKTHPARAPTLTWQA